MRALITGASSGIGRDMSRYLSELGYDLVIVARRKELLEELKSELKTDIRIECVDISNKENCEALFERNKDVDILINNAGFGKFGIFDEVLLDDEINMINTNIISIQVLTKLYLQEMKKKNKGHILNVASVAGVMGCGGAAYVASKAAVIGLTRHTALRFAGTNVRCNAICPGTIVTPMVAGMSPENMDMSIFGQMMKHNDLKVQPCMPEDVANMLLFFASDESRAITGQTIVTDFGSTL